MNKFSHQTLIILALLAQISCGHSSSSPNANPSADQPLAVSLHQKDQCPTIDGTFVNADTGSDVKSLSTTPITNGIQLEDTGVKWLIDGTSHSGEGAENLNYTGICSQSIITISLFEGTTKLGEMSYSIDAKNRMTTTLTSLDPRTGPSSQEIWHK